MISGGAVPPRGHVLRQEARVVVLGVRHPRQPEVADLEVAGGVEQQVAGLQISVENVSGVDVLQPPQYLVEEVADVVVAESLRLQKFIKIRLHQALDNVHVAQHLNVDGPQDVADVDDVLVLESVENLDLPQGSLTIGLVLEGADLLDGHLGLSLDVHGGHDHAVGPLADVLEVEVPGPHAEQLTPDELRSHATRGEGGRPERRSRRQSCCHPQCKKKVQR